jgi:oligosaccharide reducing-end xylanase
MALLFAAHSWVNGNGNGIYNYQEEADAILRRIRHHPLLTGRPPFRIHAGDPPFIEPDKPWPSPNNRHAAEEAAAQGRPWPMVDETHYMIRFVPETAIPGTDPSYHLPGFYKLWARWGRPEDRAFWAEAAKVSRDFFAKVTGPKTGLSPDRANYDATPAIGFDGKPSQFGYDSWRTVSNWSVDYSWWHEDAQEPVLSARVQRFLIGQGIHSFPDRYTLGGKPLSTRHSPGMVATAAVGGLAAPPGPETRTFLRELWNMPVPSGEQRYYDGMLYLMSMMHCAGEFRIIAPHR